MEWYSGPVREDNYEHVLMCLICRSLFDDHDHQPKFLPCHHTFCKDCLREYVRQMGDEIECPSCRKIANIPAAGVAALQTNFYVKYIQGLVSGCSSGNVGVKHCLIHSGEQLQFYCHDCQTAICKWCTKEENSTCSQHRKVTLNKATEQSYQHLDSSFSAANAAIEAKKVTLEAMLKALAQEKDQSLVRIDATFEQHVHTLHRRATLLKNKVIDIYNEHVGKLENDLEEVSTALTCIVSLKEYYERKVSNGDFKDFNKGVEEMDEVRNNIVSSIRPAENHIVFEEKHGVDKFKASAKDLGRVRNTKPPVLVHSDSAEYESQSASSISSEVGATNIDNLSSPEDVQLTPTPGQECGGFSDISLVGNTVSNIIPSIEQVMGASEVVNKSPADMPSECPNSSIKLDVELTSSVLDISSDTSDLTPKMSKEPTPEPRPAAECTDGHNCSTVPLELREKMPLLHESKVPSSLAMSDLMTKSLESKGFGGARPKTQTHSGSKLPDSKKSHKTQEISGNMHPSRPRSRLPGPDGMQLMPPSFKSGLAGNRDPNKQSTADMEKLKSDKEYYHLLYTSYDEEELLKELRLGKPRMEDSDSWMTISSAEDTSSGTSTEEIIVVEQEQTSF